MRTKQSFVCFAKKFCLQGAISSVNDVFHPPKFSQLSPKFKDGVQKIWSRPHQSSMAFGWSHEGLFSCRHCNFVARLSLRILKIMLGLLLILIQGAKKVSFTVYHSGKL